MNIEEKNGENSKKAKGGGGGSGRKGGSKKGVKKGKFKTTKVKAASYLISKKNYRGILMTKSDFRQNYSRVFHEVMLEHNLDVASSHKSVTDEFNAAIRFHCRAIECKFNYRAVFEYETFKSFWEESTGDDELLPFQIYSETGEMCSCADDEGSF